MKKFLRILFLYIPIGYIVFSILLVVMLKWMPVYLTPLMVVRGVQNFGEKSYCIKKRWTQSEDISKNMSRAVIASEDQKFFSHNGFDYDEIERMRRDHQTKGKPIRGCSTISQQTAKNCFTFCTHTWTRKAVEAYYTLLIEKIWGKERVLEVYLNVVEMGKGIYGVEAASNEYFDHKASKLSEKEAATLACCLPNPLKRTPKWVEKHMVTRRSDIMNAMQSVHLSFSFENHHSK